MNDKQLSDLFAEGTAPDHDSAFALQVAAGIGRARLRRRLSALARRVAQVLTLCATILVASRLIGPVLAQLVEGTPQLMGVPVPMAVLGGVLVTWLALGARLHIPLRRFAKPSSPENAA